MNQLLAEAYALQDIEIGQWVRYHGSQTLLTGFVYTVKDVTPSGRLTLDSGSAALPDLREVRPTSVTPLHTTID